MSIFSDSLKELKAPSKKPSNLRLWLDSLEQADRSLALEAMSDTTIKNYPLFETFRKNGMRVSKDYFFDIRRELQAGTIDPEGIR